MHFISWLVCIALLSASMALSDPKAPSIKLSVWELPEGSSTAVRGAGGIAFASSDVPDMAMYLWLYEWNMFDAIKRGQHTQGTLLREKRLSADQSQALVASPDLKITFRARDDGADMRLVVTNNSDHDWPAIAGIIPCFNPGPAASRNRQFVDEKHTRTCFLSADGLQLLAQREIHFNEKLCRLIDRESPSGNFVFSSKWPTSSTNAKAGILIRESADGQWVTGIAWQDFLSVQDHNPWDCMHVCVRVGPLKRGSTKTVRGRIYLFQGNRQDCQLKYLKEF